jgi:hypothetical protein
LYAAKKYTKSNSQINTVANLELNNYTQPNYIPSAASINNEPTSNIYPPNIYQTSTEEFSKRAL